MKIKPPKSPPTPAGIRYASFSGFGQADWRSKQNKALAMENYSQMSSSNAS